jgi:hypothetical protein
MEKNKKTLVFGILNREPQMRKGSGKTARTEIPLAYIAATAERDAGVRESLSPRIRCCVISITEAGIK